MLDIWKKKEGGRLDFYFFLFLPDAFQTELRFQLNNKTIAILKEHMGDLKNHLWSMEGTKQNIKKMNLNS